MLRQQPPESALQSASVAQGALQKLDVCVYKHESAPKFGLQKGSD